MGSNNDVWYSEDGKTWTCATNAAPWSERGFFTAVVYDNKIWVMGGKAGPSLLNDVWYSADGKNWTCAVSAAAWPVRQYFSAFIIDNKMWIVGGYGKQILNDVWHSTDGKTWNSASNAPWQKRSKHAATVFNNRVWISGGEAGYKYLNDIWYAEFPSGIQHSVKPVSIAAPVMINTIYSGASGGAVTIQYTLGRAGGLKIGVYTCKGREIETLHNGVQAAGAYTITWNGADAGGKAICAGVYLVKFETDAGALVCKIAIAE